MAFLTSIVELPVLIVLMNKKKLNIELNKEIRPDILELKIWF